MARGPFLLPLRGAIKNYAWGSRTFLAGLDGRPAPASEPEAELWLGTHAAGPAQAWWDGEWRSLRDLAARDPAGFLGASTVERFGAELPFLLKILAIDQPLSLQVHPDSGQAAAGFARERAAGIALDAGSYRDRAHKPELIVALEPLWLLRGLLPPAEIARRFAKAGIASFAAETDRLARRGDAGLRDFLGALLALAGEARARVTTEMRRAAEQARRAALARELPLYWVARMVDLHPEDPAALAPLFLHLLRLAPGEGAFQPARVLHSYLEGVGVEVMTGSDNVVRAGLTPKPVDVDELLAVVDPTPAPPVRIDAIAEGRDAARYPTPVDEFELWRLAPRSGAVAGLGEHAAPVVGICTRGSGTIEAPARAESLELASGRAFVARASAGRLEVSGDVDLFVASIATGRPSP